MNIRIGKKRLSAVAAALVLILTGMALEKGLSLGGEDFSNDRMLMVDNARAEQKEDTTLPDIIERAVPSVVNISSKRVVKTGVSPFMRDPFFRQFFERYFGDTPRERVQRNLGSGVIVDSRGYIITSNHLVGKAEEIKVTLTDEREFDAEVVGADRESDVAVIKIEGKDLPAIKVGNPDRLRLGETVIAIGYPFGVGQTVTKGIVSALGRSLRLVNYEDFIQTDAAINPGNSGGALINIDGELIGINTAIVTRSGGNQGIGFAIPIDLATTVMNSIVEHGYVIRGYLGVYPQDITHKMARIFGLDDNSGALISEVAKGTPADKAGFERGDVIIKFDGRSVEDSKHLHRIVAETTPGAEVIVEIIRDGGKEKLAVEIGQRPDAGEDRKEEQVDKHPILLGVGLENLSDYYRERLDLPSDIKGVVVTNVEGSSPAGEAGLKSGDVIVEVNRRKVENIESLEKILGDIEDEVVIVAIYREGHYFYLEIER